MFLSNAYLWRLTSAQKSGAHVYVQSPPTRVAVTPRVDIVGAFYTFVDSL